MGSIRSGLKVSITSTLVLAIAVSGLIAAPAVAAPTKQIATQPESQVEVADSGFINPLPDKSYRVVSYFGPRCLVALNSGTFHGAIDLGAAEGVDTYAMADGVVSKITQPESNRVAGTIELDHGIVDGKRLYTSYTHTWEPSKYYKVGDKVKKGAVIAPVGSSGISTGPHLHLAVRYDGVWIDPESFFRSRGLDLLAGAHTVIPKSPTASSCAVFNHAAIGLKETPAYTSKITTVIPEGTRFTVTPGQMTNMHVEARLPDGRSGWVRTGSLSNRPRDGVRPEIRWSPSEAGFTYTPHTGQQNLRDYPDYYDSHAGILTLVTQGDELVSTGRKIAGTNWEEVKFGTTTGWIDKHPLQILNAKPTTATIGPASDVTIKATSVKPLPTDNPLAKSNIPVSISSGSKLKATGSKYGSWSEVTVGGANYWTPTSNLSPYIAPKPSTSVNNPTILPGDVVARDGKGKLWNYSTLGSKPKARKLISSGWQNMLHILSTDFNGDGVIDIVANGKNGKLYLYIGKRAGGFDKVRQIGNSGWQNMELHIGKLKKSDKLPTILARAKSGKLYAYTSKGTSVAAARQIGAGWQGFSNIAVGYFDGDANLDVIAQNKAGNQLLYRTNGSTFINEKRKTVGTGWKNMRTSGVGKLRGASNTGILAVNSKGQLIYYSFTGKSSFAGAKIVGNSGWTPFYIAKS